MTLSDKQLAILSALASGIIPADKLDGGASSANAGPKIAAKIQAGINDSIYSKGLALAEAEVKTRYQRDIERLSASQIHELIGVLRDQSPAFFKQLRLDVCAIYMSDPVVWQRIGFPGPSNATGGYSDFDQPQ